MMLTQVRTSCKLEALPLFYCFFLRHARCISHEPNTCANKPHGIQINMPKQKPAIMIQGTCSNAGKSLLVAALCRIFAQDGYNPAPFKAQNMALNSFVTPDGCEIGRAQALQAIACHREPSASMNPVLLKPHSDIGSQVIIMGKPVAHMPVKEYIKYKPKAWKSVTEAYDSLATTADIMVIEGAGSPAEINLKAHDIVNMAMAKYAKAKVLLCTDIDRGGAFASLVGTLALLDKSEQDLISGFILNKFRGDASLLDPALHDITSMTQKPFLGVVPFIKNLNLPEEDSVSFRLYGEDNAAQYPKNSKNCLDVALIDLPHISNLTDIDALRVEPDVHLRIVRNVAELGTPDVLLLVGTKNTPFDLEYLHSSGLSKAITERSDKIPLILGICGGLQILGEEIHDSMGIENTESKSYAGLGLLPLRTEFLPQKTLGQCTAKYKNKLNIEGYEIHHGHTTAITPLDEVVHDVSRPTAKLGWELNTKKGRILATYLHGVLDNDEFRRVILDDVRRTKSLDPIESITPYSLGPSLNALADAVRESLDMKHIYKLLGF